MDQDQPAAKRSDITQLLNAWQSGERDALDRLMPLVYDELHVMAARHLARERSQRTLQATALVNEAYLKLIDQRRVDWQSRAHFFAIAARLMRRVVLDQARRRGRAKHGGGSVQVALDEAPLPAPEKTIDAVDVIELDRVLTELEALDPDQARVVELRFFGGLTVEEAAQVMGSSPATIKREWAIAKTWLFRALSGGAS